MHALVYHGPGRTAWEPVPDPGLARGTDAVVRIEATTVCGADLHIRRGDVPDIAPGRVLGHEGVGTVVEVGDAVRTVRPGDRVLVPAVSACGACPSCREGRAGLCTGGGGWVLGRGIDGTQAELVRVPFADTSTYAAPEGMADDELLMAADLLPTGFEVGAHHAGVRPGDVVVVVGAGELGLSVVLAARLFSPAHVVVVDRAEARRKEAMGFGADVLVDDAEEDPVAALSSFTDGRGADVVVEAVGAPASFELATRLVRPGGRIATVGVHGAPALLHLEQLWDGELVITTGLADTSSVPSLLRLISAGLVEADRFVTHHLALDAIAEAYDLMEHTEDTGALKVVLTPRR